MAQGTLNLDVIGTEYQTAPATGPGNYAGYVDLSQMVSGDQVSITQYVHIEGTTQLKAISTGSLTFDQLQLAAEDSVISIPVTLEAGQSAAIGVTLEAGTTGLQIPYRVTNIQTGA